jgi:hypothetical protein
MPSHITVRKCSSDDCKDPVTNVTNDNGVAVFTAQPGILGGVIEPTFRVEPPDYYPLILFPYYPVVQTTSFVFPALDRNSMDAFAAGSSVAVEQGMGHIGFILSDCVGPKVLSSLRDPVRVALKAPVDPMGRTRVLGAKNGQPIPDRSDQTGVIFNVPPGRATVEYFKGSNPEVLVGQRQVFVEANTVTEVLLAPTPLDSGP